MSEVLSFLVSFFIFCVLQAMFINGVKEVFSEGMILNPVRKWLNKYISEHWQMPLYTCVKCMSSFWGAITFFPLAIYLYGFRWEEIIVFIFNVGILVFLNFYLFKRQ